MLFYHIVSILLVFNLIKSSDLNDNENHFTNIHTIKLQGNTTFSYYYTNIYVGTPPQRQTVIVDTGSQLLAFPCDGCSGKNCGHHIDRPYDRSASLTYNSMQCNQQFDNFRCTDCNGSVCKWSISYSEGSSLNGVVGTDYIVLGDEVQNYFEENYQNIDMDFVKFLNHERVKIPFGCTTRETNLFLSQDADGILGLNPQTNTQQKWPNVIDALYKEHSNNGEQFAFSLCLSNEDGGFMSVGGYNKNLHKPGAKTNIISYKQGKQYTIDLKGIKINGVETIKNDNHKNGVIVDSGTTLLFGPSKVINAMYDQVYNHCNKDTKNCLGTKEVERSQACWRRDKNKTPKTKFFASFPNIIFNLETFDFVWTPENYFFIDPLRKNNEELYCFAFEASGSKILLGGSWMREYDILFDRAKREIHFTESNCNPDSIDQHYIEDNSGNVKTTEEDLQLYEQIMEELEEEQWTKYRKKDDKENQDDDKEEIKKNQVNKQSDNNNNDDDDKSEKNNQDDDQEQQNKDKDKDGQKQNNKNDGQKQQNNKNDDQEQNNKDDGLNNNNNQDDTKNTDGQNNNNNGGFNNGDINSSKDRQKVKSDSGDLVGNVITFFAILLLLYLAYGIFKRGRDFIRNRRLQDEGLELQNQEGNLNKSVHPVNQMDQSSFDNSDRMVEIDDRDEDLSKEVDSDYVDRDEQLADIQKKDSEEEEEDEEDPENGNTTNRY